MTKSGKDKTPGTNKWNGKTSHTKRKQDDTHGNLFNTNKGGISKCNHLVISAQMALRIRI